MNLQKIGTNFEFIAIHKKTKIEKRVNLISFSEKKFNCPDEKWGVWYNFSKRGEWDLFIKNYESE